MPAIIGAKSASAKENKAGKIYMCVSIIRLIFSKKKI